MKRKDVLKAFEGNHTKEYFSPNGLPLYKIDSYGNQIKFHYEKQGSEVRDGRVYDQGLILSKIETIPAASQNNNEKHFSEYYDLFIRSDNISHIWLLS